MIPLPESLISDARLTRAERLRGRKTFDLLFHLAKRWEDGALRLYGVAFLINLGLPRLQVAFAVPKKVLRKAAHRNRIRRRLREAYRQEKAGFLRSFLWGQGWLLWQWRSSEVPTIPALRLRMRDLFERFHRECCDTFSSD